MKNSFKEYYSLSSSDLDKLWKYGIIVFDTNVLLSLYRRSEDVRNDFISIIRSFKDRIWLPHQVGYEYHEHRLEEAMRPIEAVNAIMDKLQKFEKGFEQEYGNNPYLDYKKIKKAFKTFGSRIDKLIQSTQYSFPDFLQNDDILSTLSELFDGRIGPEYQDEMLKEVYKMGNERYTNKIPPGYKDSKKHEGERHRFGDLIIWLQIIEHAKSEARDIIFVTDDRKEDWWEEYKGNMVGPRHELIREFRSKTNNQQIWFYTPDRFLKYVKSKAGVSVNPKTIEEVKKPPIDWFSEMGQGSLSGQVYMDGRWPLISLGESEPLDIGVSHILASNFGGVGHFSSMSLGESVNSDLIKNTVSSDNGQASVVKKIESDIIGLSENSPFEITKKKSIDNKKDKKQDKKNK